MQTATAISSRRFVRRTALHSGEYRKNFRQIDCDAIEIVTSDEACRVTSLMSKVYLRLIDAPLHLREREGVLRFTGEEQEGRWQTAWQQLISMLGVASATAQKALNWMHEQGVIGYDAHRNGVGIRVFINRATTSIGKGAARTTQKNLPRMPTSPTPPHTSPGDMPFKDTFGTQDNLDLNLIPSAPKNGADARLVDKKSFPLMANLQPPAAAQSRSGKIQTNTPMSSATAVNEIIERLRCEIEPCLKIAATQAATQAAAHEVARTREWFEKKALPKAVRVAQSETYNILRKYGALDARQERICAELRIGRAPDVEFVSTPTQPLEQKEIKELAETCVALWEMQGKAIDVTLSEISAEKGKWLLPSDVPKVREAANALLKACNERGK